MTQIHSIIRVFVALAIGSLFADAKEQREVGKGILNQKKITTSEALANIDEVLAFHAFEPDSRTGTIRFLFEIADVEFESGISPNLIIRHRGNWIASVRPETTWDDSGVVRETPYNLIEFALAPEYVKESELVIQLYPNTEKLVTYQIATLAASVLQMRNKKARKTPMHEFLKTLGEIQPTPKESGKATTDRPESRCDQ